MSYPELPPRSCKYGATVTYSLHWPTVIKAILAFVFFVTCYGIAEKIG